jgi:hypothetical protein
LDFGELKPTKVVFQLADQSVRILRVIVEDVLVQIDHFYFPMYFIVLDTQPIPQSNTYIPIILERPFLTTSNTLTNYRNEIIKFTFGNMTTELNIFNICKQPTIDDEDEEVHEVNMIRSWVEGKLAHSIFSNPIEACLLNPNNDNIELNMVNDVLDVILVMETNGWRPCFEELPTPSKPLPFIIQAPTLDLKPLSSELKYAYLGQDETLPVVISAHLDATQESKLLNVLIEHKGVIGWTIADIKGIGPSICTHRIHLEEEVRPSRESQCRLNRNMKEVVRVEVLKLLNADIIYSIADSR